MADAESLRTADELRLTPICPWCSAALPTPDALVCPACAAHLVEDEDVVVPGVTAVDPELLAAAAAPRKVKRTFGALLVREDDGIPPPTEAEMPALAPPDEAVRREMLRLELDARLRALQSEIAADEASRDTPPAPVGAAPVEAAEPDPPGGPAADPAETSGAAAE